MEFFENNKRFVLECYAVFWMIFENYDNYTYMSFISFWLKEICIL